MQMTTEFEGGDKEAGQKGRQAGKKCCNTVYNLSKEKVERRSRWQQKKRLAIRGSAYIVAYTP